MTGTKKRLGRLLASAACAALVGCTDAQPMGVDVETSQQVPPTSLAAFECVASTSGTVDCSDGRSVTGGVSAALIGGQNTYVRLSSSNVSYDSATTTFEFDVTVQNLMNEAIGTPDGSTADPDGIQVFFASGPTATGGSGTISVTNAAGIGTFTQAGQPYFAYHEILPKDAVSAAQTWQLNIPTTVSTFSFTLYIETDVQLLLVFNELFANPGGTISDASGEWLEIYNAGTRAVNLQNLVVADSAPSGRRPYHVISVPLEVASGGYVTLGNSANTTNNGGVPVDYSYGLALAFANSLDAVKIARVYGTDTLTIDRTQYASAVISAQNGISRELINPALDNSNMDGSNWQDASVTAVYGPGGRGTPGAQNSTYTP